MVGQYGPTMNSIWSVVRPAISAVECVEVLNVRVESILRELAAIFLQS